SCRLSVELNMFGGIVLVGAIRKRRIAERLRMVVAVLRPSELSEASLAKSSVWRNPYETPQCKQKRNGAGTKWQSSTSSSDVKLSDGTPSARTHMESGRSLRRMRRMLGPLRCSSR